MTITITEARTHFADIANRVTYQGERIYVEKNGKRAFALVPVSDAEMLEAMETKIDLDAAKEALERNDFVSWEKAQKELGLK